MSHHQQPQTAPQQKERRALKIKEAAAILGVGKESVRRLIERGLLKPCRALRHPLIPVEQIEALLNNR